MAAPARAFPLRLERCKGFKEYVLALTDQDLFSVGLNIRRTGLAVKYKKGHSRLSKDSLFQNLSSALLLSLSVLSFSKALIEKLP